MIVIGQLGFLVTIGTFPAHARINSETNSNSDTKNQCYHQPTEMKFCMSHYSYKYMPDARFESGSFFSFGDMMSQNFPLKWGTSYQIRIFTLGRWDDFEKMSFRVQNRSFQPKIDPTMPI